MRVFVFLSAMAMLCGTAWADKLTAEIKRDGDHWVLDGIGKNPDGAKVATQIARARAQLESVRTELLGKQYDQARLTRLENALKAMDEMIRSMVSKVYDKAEAKDLEALKADVARLRSVAKGQARVLGDQRKRVAKSEKRLSLLEARRISLDVAGFGGGAMKYDHTAGASVSLILPLGSGRWSTKLIGGLGIGPSNGLGALAAATVTARLDRFTIGPAAIFMADLDDLTSGVKRFVLGGGLEASIFITDWLYVSVLPFVGVGVQDTGTWVPPVYQAVPGQAPCACGGGGVLVSEGRWIPGKRCTAFTAGAIGSIGFRLF